MVNNNIPINQFIIKNEDSDFIDPSKNDELGQTCNGVAKITIIYTFDSIPIFYTIQKRFQIGNFILFVTVILFVK